LNSDAVDYGGSGVGNLGAVHAQPEPWRDRSHTLHITAPPLGCVFFRRDPAT
jgi:1,4-alpha-glucan branching enzyme